MSSSVRIDAPTEVLSKAIYFDAFKEDSVRIRCNQDPCEKDILWSGSDWEHVDFDWLGMMIEHIVSHHPELFA